MQLVPELGETRQRLAQIHLAQGDFAEAIDQFHQLLRRNPTNADVLVELSFVLSATDSPDVRDDQRALELAQRACQITGRREPVSLDALAAAYAELKDFERARTTAEKAHQLAIDSNRRDLADEITKRLHGYRQRQPHRTQPPASKP